MPLSIPTVGVVEAPTVVMKFNATWLGYIMGAVAFLDQDAVWNSEDPDELYDVRQQIEQIFTILALGNAVETPIGAILPFAGTDVPAGFLACNGAQYLKDDYPLLAMILHSSYEDDATHFHVPDMRNRVPMGSNGNVIGDNTGATGGEAEHVLTTAEMPSHTHVQNSHLHNIAHTHTFFGRVNGLTPGTSNRMAMADMSGSNSTPSTQTQSTTDSGSTTATNQNTGGGGAHNNLQPYLAVRYIIRAE